MNLSGEVKFELLGMNYTGRFTWDVYEKIKDETGQCPYAVFTRISEKASSFVANEMFQTDSGVSTSCAELSEVISAKFAYSLLYHLARAEDSAVTSEEIQHGILHEGTFPSLVFDDDDSTGIECQGYCFKVMEIAIDLLGIGSSKKSEKPQFSTFIARKVQEVEIEIHKAMEYSKAELGLNAEEFLRSSPNLFFSHILSKQDKDDITRYDMCKQVRLWNRK